MRLCAIAHTSNKFMTLCTIANMRWYNIFKTEGLHRVETFYCFNCHKIQVWSENNTAQFEILGLYSVHFVYMISITIIWFNFWLRTKIQFFSTFRQIWLHGDGKIANPNKKYLRKVNFYCLAQRKPRKNLLLCFKINIDAREAVGLSPNVIRCPESARWSAALKLWPLY